MSVRRDPSKDLDVQDGDVAKILFLSVSPDHQTHLEVETSPDSPSDSNCRLCRIIERFKDYLMNKNIRGLKRELRLKVIKLSEMKTEDNQEFSTLEGNFSEFDDELDADDEELLTFMEVLDLMQIKIPEKLEKKRNELLTTKRIPARKAAPAQNSDNPEETARNTFFAYTINKILSEIADTLSGEEVYGMKEFLIKQQEHDESMANLRECLAEINDKENIVSSKALKDVLFYLIVLTMYRDKFLSRLHTHILEFAMKGSKANLEVEDCKERPHIDAAIKKLSRYPLTSYPPGVCMIFAMTEDREGADNDVKSVQSVFKNHFNFDVFVKRNPTQNDIKKFVTKLSSRTYMFYDSLVVWFMGHGTKTNLIVKDGQIHRRTELIQPFVDIEWLKRKPKLFFIQACADRQKSRHSMIEGPGMKADTDSLSLGIGGSESWVKNYGAYTEFDTVNPLADTLVSYATMWYEKASRNENGSLFVNTLMDSLKEYGRDVSIEKVLRMTHYKVNTVALQAAERIWKQAPYYESSLQKEFVLPSNP